MKDLYEIITKGPRGHRNKLEDETFTLMAYHTKEEGTLKVVDLQKILDEKWEELERDLEKFRRGQRLIEFTEK